MTSLTAGWVRQELILVWSGETNCSILPLLQCTVMHTWKKHKFTKVSDSEGKGKVENNIHLTQAPPLQTQAPPLQTQAPPLHCDCFQIHVVNNPKLKFEGHTLNLGRMSSTLWFGMRERDLRKHALSHIESLAYENTYLAEWVRERLEEFRGLRMTAVGRQRSYPFSSFQHGLEMCL